MKSSVLPAHPLLLLALAIVLMLPSPRLAAADAMPAEQVAGDVTYVSGGVGADEIETMKAAAASYPLELVFVGKNEDGHEAYLADVAVKVVDAQGQIALNALTNGPFLLARLPAGPYTIQATYQDQVRQHRAKINVSGHTRLVFVW